MPNDKQIVKQTNVFNLFTSDSLNKLKQDKFAIALIVHFIDVSLSALIFE